MAAKNTSTVPGTSLAGLTRNVQRSPASPTAVGSNYANLRTHINTPGYAESKFLAQHFAAMCRSDQLTILALVHSRALAEKKRHTQHSAPTARTIVARKGAE